MLWFEQRLHKRYSVQRYKIGKFKDGEPLSISDLQESGKAVVEKRELKKH
jgi:hypothetical protein